MEGCPNLGCHRCTLWLLSFTKVRELKLASIAAEKLFIQETLETMDGKENEGYVVRVVSKRYGFPFALPPNPIICHGCRP